LGCVRPIQPTSFSSRTRARPICALRSKQQHRHMGPTGQPITSRAPCVCLSGTWSQVSSTSLNELTDNGGSSRELRASVLTKPPAHKLGCAASLPSLNLARVQGRIQRGGQSEPLSPLNFIQPIIHNDYLLLSGEKKSKF
jgi:hypothetical protein